MNDKKIELISAKGAMGVTEFALLYFCLLYTSYLSCKLLNTTRLE